MTDHLDKEGIIKDLPYSDKSSRNVLDVHVLNQEAAATGLWIIYIHGGAWRDPTVDQASFDATKALLLDSNLTTSSICGIASIDYRLSPHPEYPADHLVYASDPQRPSREGRHPHHIHDVLTAIAFLQQRYGFTSNYILVGHSCGATLALQVAMSRSWSSTGTSTAEPSGSVPRPVAPVTVLAVEGIYDIPDLVAYHETIPAYALFIRGAFGERNQIPLEGGAEVDVWSNVSPTSGDYTASTWPEGRYVLVAHSRGDELVEWEQADSMVDRLKSRGFELLQQQQDKDLSGRPDDRQVEVIELTGRHNEIWEQGPELKRAIEHAIRRTRQILHLR